MIDDKDRRIAVLEQDCSELRAAVAKRRERAVRAIETLRARFALRPDCLFVDEAAQDAVDHMDLSVKECQARTDELAAVRRDWAAAEAALAVSAGELAEARAELSAAQAQLDSLRIAALVIHGAARGMVEATGRTPG